MSETSGVALCSDVQVDVRDSGVPPNNGSTTLRVDILDVNDERPTFGQSM